MFRVHILLLVSLSLSCFIAFFGFWQGQRTYLCFWFLLILLCDLLGRQNPLFARFVFLLTITMSVLLARIRWCVCMSKSQRILYVSFPRKNLRLYIPLVRVVNDQSLVQFPMDHLPCLVVFNFIGFCANLLHFLIIWIIVLFQSPHNLLSLFYCDLSLLLSLLSH